MIIFHADFWSEWFMYNVQVVFSSNCWMNDGNWFGNTACLCQYCASRICHRHNRWHWVHTIQYYRPHWSTHSIQITPRDLIFSNPVTGPVMAQRGGRGIALLFQDLGARRGQVVSSTPRPHFTPGKDPVPIAQEAGWTPGLVWTGRESRPHRDSIPGPI
jgi:hypothetical protein